MREVKISIKSKDEFNESEIIIYGKTWEEEDTTFLMYVDKSLEDKSNKTVIAYDNNSLSYQKYGKYSLEMNFEEGKTLSVSMQTEYGVMDAVLNTKRLLIEKKLEGANIAIDYTLIFAGSKAIKHSISIKFSYVMTKERI